MTVPADLALPSSLQTRVETLAAKSGRSPVEVVTDALENGHSLDWQEHFVEQVLAGIEDADKGNFASPAEIQALRNKYRTS